MIRVIVLLVILLLTLVVGWYLPHFKAMDFFAILLVLLAGLMTGIGCSNGRSLTMIVAVVVGTAFVALTLIGLWKLTWLIPMGYIIYSIWSVVQYYTSINRAQVWFLPWLAVNSIVIAGFIYIRFSLIS